MRTWLLFAWLAAGCSAGPARPERDPASFAGTVRKQLPAGTTVELAAVDRFAAADGSDVDTRAVEGLLREALRQSARLDFAAGAEVCAAPWQIVVGIDAHSSRLSTSLLPGRAAERPDTVDAAAIPLASVEIGGRRLADAIDELAAETRASLGDAMTDAMASAELYSANATCVALTERAIVAQSAGRVEDARGLLERARRADPGCTLALSALANARLDAGDHTAAIEIANQTLQHFKPRLGPTTRIRAARTLLLARAARADRAAARAFDEQLLALGDAAMRDRPFDPHARYTRGLALNYLGRFAEARTELAPLLDRWPRVGVIAYHLAFAELACGDAAAARATTDRVRDRMPASVTMLPTALALWHDGRGDELRDRLASMLEDRPSPRQAHELYRMSAALEILSGRDEPAARALLDDLDWLRRNPFLLENRANELAEAGEVLLALGYADELAPRIEALEPVVRHSASSSQALTYLAGLSIVARGEPTPQTAIATLERGKRSVWTALLRAAGHRSRGELVDETRELSTAIRLSDAALVRAKLSRSLRELGRTEQAEALMRDLRENLLEIDLRRPMRHPLLSPARALAFR